VICCIADLSACATGGHDENQIHGGIIGARGRRNRRYRNAGASCPIKAARLLCRRSRCDNLDAYTKEYAPKAAAIIKAHGGRLLAVGQNVTALDGTPPAKRVAIQQWESLEKIKAWHSSPEYKDARKIGEQYAKFRSWAVEGISE
jgi:uncharacterized protein (DUF1330 family)